MTFTSRVEITKRFVETIHTENMKNNAINAIAIAAILPTFEGI